MSNSGLLTAQNRPTGKRVMMMATCLCDAFFDDVAKASVEVLEYLGCEVLFPEGQTCCGQPAFNSGDWDSSRKVVRHTERVFSGAEPVIVPSGSCAAMLFHGAPLEFEKCSDAKKVDALANRTWEIIDFIVNGLGVKEWPGTLNERVVFHESCHSRGTKSGEAIRTLLGSIAGLKVSPIGESEQCCGFGGTFSVSFPNISTAMGDLKIEHVLEANPDWLVSGDMSCMMHLRGLAEKEGRQLRVRHVIQILRDALASAHLLP
ncbi:MAG: (Fe-S)-binding protein [Chthoniobacterales bacterium]